MAVRACWGVLCGAADHSGCWREDQEHQCRLLGRFDARRLENAMALEEPRQLL